MEGSWEGLSASAARIAQSDGLQESAQPEGLVLGEIGRELELGEHLRAHGEGVHDKAGG